MISLIIICILVVIVCLSLPHQLLHIHYREGGTELLFLESEKRHQSS